MAANAPYYQMRAGQFNTQPNSINATPSHFISEDEEYDVSAAAAASPHGHHPLLHSEYTARPSSADTPMNSTEENHNLAELLEAATTAACQAAQAMDAHDALNASTTEQVRGKRKRVSSPLVDNPAMISHAEDTFTPKRRRTDVPTDPQLQDDDCDTRGTSTNATVPPSGKSLLNSAGAASVHSAAALFRRSSEKTSRKYTRPPMSKLYMSLQLSPENFLQLQALAKAYMLDPAYPERQNCVGNRGKGDTDMIKLRLFNCVRDFLIDGAGEQYFGEHIEKPGERDAIEAARALGEEKAPNNEEKLTWPRDGNKIISLVTPLMRRMVTNERQRMYAIETRKGGIKKNDKAGSVQPATQQVQVRVANDSPAGTSNCGQSVVNQSAFDPLLHQSQSQPASPSIETPDPPGRLVIIARSHPATPKAALSLLKQPNILTVEEPAKVSLSHINIFLVLAGVKLFEKRISAEPPDHLMFVQWDDFLREVTGLLNKAMHGFASPPATTVITPQIDESLRGLAAAANALQSDIALAEGDEAVMHGKTMSSTRKTPDLRTRKTLTGPQADTHSRFSACDLDDSKAVLLSHYTIKTVGPDGWETIANGAQWSGLLQRRAREIWADGVINVIVELVA